MIDGNHKRAWLYAGVAVAVLLAALLGFCTQGHAHDWYPPECCAAFRDCRPVPCSQISEATVGHMATLVWSDGNDKRWYIERRKLRASQDNGCHVCVWPGTNNLRCVFMPTKVS